MTTNKKSERKDSESRFTCADARTIAAEVDMRIRAFESTVRTQLLDFAKTARGATVPNVETDNGRRDVSSILEAHTTELATLATRMNDAEKRAADRAAFDGRLAERVLAVERIAGTLERWQTPFASELDGLRAASIRHDDAIRTAARGIVELDDKIKSVEGYVDRMLAVGEALGNQLTDFRQSVDERLTTIERGGDDADEERTAARDLVDCIQTKGSMPTTCADLADDYRAAREATDRAASPIPRRDGGPDEGTEVDEAPTIRPLVDHPAIRRAIDDFAGFPGGPHVGTRWVQLVDSSRVHVVYLRPGQLDRWRVDLKEPIYADELDWIVTVVETGPRERPIRRIRANQTPEPIELTFIADDGSDGNPRLEMTDEGRTVQLDGYSVDVVEELGEKAAIAAARVDDAGTPGPDGRGAEPVTDWELKELDEILGYCLPSQPMIRNRIKEDVQRWASRLIAARFAAIAAQVMLRNVSAGRDETEANRVFRVILQRVRDIESAG